MAWEWRDSGGSVGRRGGSGGRGAEGGGQQWQRRKGPLVTAAAAGTVGTAGAQAQGERCDVKVEGQRQRQGGSEEYTGVQVQGGPGM